MGESRAVWGGWGGVPTWSELKEELESSLGGWKKGLPGRAATFSMGLQT